MLEAGITVAREATAAVMADTPTEGADRPMVAVEAPEGGRMALAEITVGTEDLTEDSTVVDPRGTGAVLASGSN